LHARARRRLSPGERIVAFCVFDLLEKREPLARSARHDPFMKDSGYVLQNSNVFFQPIFTLSSSS
jgi:hypothetical protein